jgi:hypothetical protein
MDPIKVTAIAFLCGLLGILLGSLSRRRLPPDKLGHEARDAIKLGLVVSLSALVLSLLVVSAKSGYEMRRSEINQITAGVLLLDHLLSQYGDATKAARIALRKEIPLVVSRIWSEERSPERPSGPFKSLAEGEALFQHVLDLKPADDVQRQLQAKIVQSVNDLSELRLVLFSHFSSSIPVPFLIVLLLWIIVLFAGFSLLAPLNPVPMTFLVVCALSVSGAVFLLLELDQPFTGIMMIPDDLLREALRPLD